MSTCIDKINLFKEFQRDWPLAKIQNLTIEQYTDLVSNNPNTFIHTIEGNLDLLGSIWGGSAFKFGIYKMKNIKNFKAKSRYMSDGVYAWTKKYGSNANDAFEKIKQNILKVINCVNDNNFKEIDNVDLGDAYKWKIAFHYQNISNLQIIPIFSHYALKLYLTTKKAYNKNTMDKSRFNIYQKIKELNSLNNFNNLKDYLQIGESIWNDYIDEKIYDPQIEDNMLNQNEQGLSKHKIKSIKQRAEYTEYLIKEQKRRVRFRHRKLEDSFDKYLQSIKTVSNIKQEKDFIDFQFDYNNEHYICELKPTANKKEIKYAIRYGIGQLLEYNWNVKSNKSKMILVVEHNPSKQQIELLKLLKIKYLYKCHNKFKGNIKL